MLSPVPTETEILGKLGVAPEARGAFAEIMAGAIPRARLGRPEDRARAALFIGSDAIRFVTGINLRGEGGTGLHGFVPNHRRNNTTTNPPTTPQTPPLTQ